MPHAPRRWVVLQVCPQELQRARRDANSGRLESSVLAEVRAALLRLLGDYGLGTQLPSLQICFASEHTGVLLFRCSAKHMHTAFVAVHAAVASQQQRVARTLVRTGSSSRAKRVAIAHERSRLISMHASASSLDHLQSLQL